MPYAREVRITAPRGSAHLPATLVTRPRLAEAMSDPSARLVVVTGPAGSGKSVTVRAWAVSRPEPTAWLSLDARHTDPEHFLDALMHALEEVSPGLLEAIWHDDPDDHAADQALERACEHLAAAPPAHLVLDDVHVIDRSPTVALLSRLVDVLGATNLTLVICSRSDPPLALHPFRLAGSLVELREADLRFGADEAARFFAGFPGLDLGVEHVERLVERTEGWAAGLQFAALSLTGRRDADAFVERFAGSDRHIADFLLDEVLERQPTEIHDFLLATSVLDHFTADLCRHVTGRDDAAALLRRIEADHLFLVPLDEAREWFRYHHLFGQLLRRELRLTCPGLEWVVHRRAAEWFTAHDHPLWAIDHLLEAGQFHGAFELLVGQLNPLLRGGRHETVRNWLARFPSSFVDATPGHQLLFTWAYARAGHLDKARHALARGRARARDGDDAFREASVHYDVAEAAVASVLGDPDTALAVGDRTWDRRGDVDLDALPHDLAAAAREMWGYLPTALARAAAMNDDRPGVRRWAAVIRRQGPRLPSDLVSTLGAEAWVEARRGRFRTAHELADQALALGTEHGRGSRRAMIGARTTLALVHRERDDLDAAVEVLAPHLEAALREGHVGITTMGELELARVDCARGEGDAALDRLQRVRHDRAARGTPAFLARAIDSAECRIRLHTGDLDRARDLLDDIPPGPERTLLAARADLLEGRGEQVEAALADLLDADDDRRRRFEAVALSARAAAERGDPVAARRLLGGVAESARREGAVRVFLDEGFDILDVVVTQSGAVAGTATANAALIEQLSDRELSVLRYLPSRMSNREIGAELYVSLNTVKSHLKTIYRKLGVDRRDEAVRRARQLGII